MADWNPLQIATGALAQLPPDWMPASHLRPLVLGDPLALWLQFHGAAHGFQPDEKSDYEFADFIFAKGRQFESAWLRAMAPHAVTVCRLDFDVHFRQKVEQTFDLMNHKVPVIVHPALWWAPERIYGVPDLIALASWTKERFPSLAVQYEIDHYAVLDFKFTTGLDSGEKQPDFGNYAAQVRLYSYMVGQLQRMMPQYALLITRDRVFDPIAVPIASALGQPLDPDLQLARDRYLDIKLNGANYLPWRDPVAASDVANALDDDWQTARRVIATELVPGGDAARMYQIGASAKAALAAQGFPTLKSLLEAEPDAIPFERCSGLGEAKASRIRAILKASKSGRPVFPPSHCAPARRSHEFFVDFEFFTNVNVDFEAQWPTLDGCEMIFMIGLGWERDGQWRFETFIAPAESHDAELGLFDRFLAFLDEQTRGSATDPDTTVLYHWTSAEAWQLNRVCDRHQIAADHPTRSLPWHDLQRQPFLVGPVAIPGAWDYGLKTVTKALGAYDANYRVEWPGTLDAGLRAMVMGWRAYQAANPLETAEMKTLKQYLEIDCKAMWTILRWLRAQGRPKSHAAD